jgi:hypothetical protein
MLERSSIGKMNKTGGSKKDSGEVEKELSKNR